MEIILVKVNELTDWLSQIVIMVKTPGRYRSRVDPKLISETLSQELAVLPVFAGILSELSSARCFTRIDLVLASGYSD